MEKQYVILEAYKLQLLERKKGYADYYAQYITCKCGTPITRGNHTVHKRSMKHKKLMLALPEEIEVYSD
jgi:hypothetical protein|tara:strand:+ start:82 stop:288 length:207 start_codon:yes stop_codon:yes gene_type:complete